MLGRRYDIFGRPPFVICPARHLAAPKTMGFCSSFEEEIANYQARHPLGTRARLALEIMPWTGQRRGDARLLGPEQVVNGQINYRQGKTGTDLWLPAAPQLPEAIAAMQRAGFKTFLVTEPRRLRQHNARVVR